MNRASPRVKVPFSIAFSTRAWYLVPLGWLQDHFFLLLIASCHSHQIKHTHTPPTHTHSLAGGRPGHRGFDPAISGSHREPRRLELGLDLVRSLSVAALFPLRWTCIRATGPRSDASQARNMPTCSNMWAAAALIFTGEPGRVPLEATDYI